jgi:hypothetical protein
MKWEKPMRKMINFILADCAAREVEVEFVSRIPSVPAHWLGAYDGTIWVCRTSEWPLILAHEYCHSCQDRLNTPLWQAYQADDAYAGEMERECELMVLGLLDMFGYSVEAYSAIATQHLQEAYGVKL